MSIERYLERYLDELREARARDRRAYEEHDGDLCMICHAYGCDKRSFFVSSGYEMKEIAPEFLDLAGCDEPVKGRGYYLNLCKSCRGAFLTALRTAADERRGLRDTPKDHDGYVEDDPERDIPVRVAGATVMMTADEYAQWKAGR